jgi:hypothetical protein
MAMPIYFSAKCAMLHYFPSLTNASLAWWGLYSWRTKRDWNQFWTKLANGISITQLPPHCFVTKANKLILLTTSMFVPYDLRLAWYALPPRQQSYYLRATSHEFTLPIYDPQLHRNFIYRMLFTEDIYVWIQNVVYAYLVYISLYLQ